MPAELGSDIAGVWDLTPTIGISTGRTALAEAILRRLITPRGALIGVPAYGYDVVNLIGSTALVSDVEQRVREQVKAEEEVLNVRVDVTFDGRTGVLVNILVRVADGPFELTITQSTDLTTKAFLDGVLFAQSDPSNDNALTTAA